VLIGRRVFVNLVFLLVSVQIAGLADFVGVIVIGLEIVYVLDHSVVLELGVVDGLVAVLELGVVEVELGEALEHGVADRLVKAFELGVVSGPVEVLEDVIGLVVGH